MAPRDGLGQATGPGSYRGDGNMHRAGDLNAIANNPTVLESLAQTDSTGHYRLDVPAGRYFIAAGSVD